MWWGDFSIPVNHARAWQLGPLSLRIARLPKEWVVVSEQSLDPFVTEVSVSEAVPWEPEGPPAKGECQRLGVQGKGTRIRLRPALANRSIVARLPTPFLLPAGEQVDIYITSPLWLTLTALDPERTLIEIPTFRPKDTWLGTNMQQGLLCYGSRDPARTHLDDLPAHPVRAISKIRVSNGGEETVPLPRVLLPTGLLKLFVDKNHRFWTQELALQLGRELEPVLGKGAPKDADHPREIADARGPEHPHSLLTTLGGMLN